MILKGNLEDNKSQQKKHIHDYLINIYTVTLEHNNVNEHYFYAWHYNEHKVYHKNLNRKRHPVSPLTNTAAQQDVFPAPFSARQV